jgi:hypothetical protein
MLQYADHRALQNSLYFQTVNISILPNLEIIKSLNIEQKNKIALRETQRREIFSLLSPTSVTS